jgi:hypothetical protein
VKSSCGALLNFQISRLGPTSTDGQKNVYLLLFNGTRYHGAQDRMVDDGSDLRPLKWFHSKKQNDKTHKKICDNFSDSYKLKQINIFYQVFWQLA